MAKDSHETMALGRQAVVIASIVKPFIDEKVTDTVHQMAAKYRAGHATPEWLLGKTAEVSAMLGLLSELESIHRRGTAAVEKEMRNVRVD